MVTNTCKNCAHFRDLSSNRIKGLCELHSALHYLDDSCKMFTTSQQTNHHLAILRTKGAIERCICNGAFIEIPHKKPDFRCAFRGRMIDDFRYNMLFAESPTRKVIEDIIEAMSVRVLEEIEQRGGSVDDYEIDAFTDYESPLEPRIIINLYRK